METDQVTFQVLISLYFTHCSITSKIYLIIYLYLTCGIGPVWMGHGCANRPRVDLVMEIAASWRSKAAGVEMMVRVIEWMDGMSTNHSCEWIQDRKMLNIQTSMHTDWNAPFPSLCPQSHWTGEPAAQQIYNDTKMTGFSTNFPALLQHLSCLHAKTQNLPKRQSSSFSVQKVHLSWLYLSSSFCYTWEKWSSAPFRTSMYFTLCCKC